MSIVTDVIQSTVAVLKGMKRTLSEIPREKWTVQYPDVPITVQPRYRGQHLLHVDELGREKCVACFLCAAACPSECIYIEAADDPRPAEERTGGEMAASRIDRRQDANPLDAQMSGRKEQWEESPRHPIVQIVDEPSLTDTREIPIGPRRPPERVPRSGDTIGRSVERRFGDDVTMCVMDNDC